MIVLRDKEFAARELLQKAWKNRPKEIGGFNKDLSKAITKTKQQVENASINALRSGNPQRMQKIKDAARARAEKLANIDNANRASNNLISGKQMYNTIMH